jgi:hypothetical protein
VLHGVSLDIEIADDRRWKHVDPVKKREPIRKREAAGVRKEGVLVQ